FELGSSCTVYLGEVFLGSLKRKIDFSPLLIFVPVESYTASTRPFEPVASACTSKLPTPITNVRGFGLLALGARNSNFVRSNSAGVATACLATVLTNEKRPRNVTR